MYSQPTGRVIKGGPWLVETRLRLYFILAGHETLLHSRDGQRRLLGCSAPGNVLSRALPRTGTGSGCRGHRPGNVSMCSRGRPAPSGADVPMQGQELCAPGSQGCRPPGVLSQGRQDWTFVFPTVHPLALM